MKKFLTIVTRNINNLGPGKFRAGAKTGKEQICYNIRNRKDRFLAVRKKTS